MIQLEQNPTARDRDADRTTAASQMRPTPAIGVQPPGESVMSFVLAFMVAIENRLRQRRSRPADPDRLAA